MSVLGVADVSTSLLSYSFLGFVEVWVAVVTVPTESGTSTFGFQASHGQLFRGRGWDCIPSTLALDIAPKLGRIGSRAKCFGIG